MSVNHKQQSLANLLEELQKEVARLAEQGVTPEQVEVRVRDQSAGSHHEIDDLFTVEPSDAGEQEAGMKARLLISF